MAVIELTAYTDQTAIEKLLSVAGVALRISDLPVDTMDDAIQETSAIIEEYCRLRYTPEKLATSAWVAQRAKVIGAVVVCQLMGNPVPASLQERYEHILERLELVRKGNLHIPDIAARKGQAPVMSNHRVIMRPHPRTVTERRRSTGKVDDYRRERDPWEYGNMDYVI